MIVFPNAKINLGLNVTGKRPDGFHSIETVFYPVGLCDILEVLIAGDKQFSFQSSGLNIPGDAANNLCVKAYQLLSSKRELPPIKIHLHKCIPTGAGIGGGSSDGAFMIRLLNDLFSLELSLAEMTSYASALGSDCSFFIGNKPASATGKGDQLKPVGVDLSGYKTALVIPGIHVDTKNAYQWVDDQRSQQTDDGSHNPLLSNPNLPVEAWKDLLINDFENPVFSHHPEIGRIKNILYDIGAVYTSMTGSGSGVYGLFKDQITVPKELENYFFWIG
jgi:4-diphosphocytidyl-2-C-methyl-D-erythritol kinase